MGLKGVCKLINSLAPDAVTQHNLSDYSKKIIAIDTGFLFYRFSYFNPSGTNLVNNFAKLCIKYLNNGIRPVFIFDGPPPVSKYSVIEKRSKSRQKVQDIINNCDTVQDKNKIAKLKRQSIVITKIEKKPVYDFLVSAGFDVFISPSEAENMCAYLQRTGVVDYTYTDDSDAFVLGCETVLRNFSSQTNMFDHVDMNKVLLRMDLSLEQFIDMCILCGCDHTGNLSLKMSQQRAYELINRYKTIENIICYTDEIPVTGFDFKTARDVFVNFSSFENIDTSLHESIVANNDINNFGVDKYILQKLKQTLLRYFHLSQRWRHQQVTSANSLLACTNDEVKV